MRNGSKLKSMRRGRRWTAHAVTSWPTQQNWHNYAKPDTSLKSNEKVSRKQFWICQLYHRIATWCSKGVLKAFAEIWTNWNDHLRLPQTNLISHVRKRCP